MHVKISCRYSKRSAKFAWGSWKNTPCPTDNNNFNFCSCNGECARVSVGILCNTQEGWVAWRLNEHNGFKVNLEKGWEYGVEIKLEWNAQFECDKWKAQIDQPSKVPVGLYDVPFV